MALEFYWVYITVPSEVEAKRIGRALLEARLAAGVNLIGGMTSMYWWEDEIQESRETALIAKTEKTHLPALMDKVRSLHTYRCPCIIALPIQDGSPDFLEWLARETKKNREEKTQ